jgi:hypothetical protein
VNLTVTPERINRISNQVVEKMTASLAEIDAINLQVRLLSFNARIEAAKAGDAGRTFAVVAAEMEELSHKTAAAAGTLASESRAKLAELAAISQRLATDVRGQRLSDLAMTNIELIDRNLYERSCDVRWWATDPSVVEALENPTRAGVLAQTSGRLATILKAYTVYYDIVVADLTGRVLVNGKPRQFDSVGRNVSTQTWFRSALATASGDEFGFESVHASPLVGQRRILSYSCGIRTGGQAQGQLLGVLGILFNWDSLAQTVVENTPLTPEEKRGTRVCIVDNHGALLADTHQVPTKERLAVFAAVEAYRQKRGYKMLDHGGDQTLVAFGVSPGYETYASGWCGMIVQDQTKFRHGS